MSTRKPTPRNRALRPGAEGLEERRLLSATVSGMDAKGDFWTLQLIGPGSLVVTKQPDANGNPTGLNALTDISTITIGGTDPKTTRLIDHVTPAAGSDGRVFFETLIELQNKSNEQSAGLGPLSINIPDFWLGNTTTFTSTSTSPPSPTISIPDGVSTLRFGGVDTTFNQNPTAAAETYTVALGLPQYGGSRVIINKSISSQTTATASGSTTPSAFQNAVVFAVSGRLDLFQANSIDGDANIPPGQFLNNNQKATGFGGTWVVSGTPNTTGFGSPFFVNPFQQGVATGAIGNLRIGGDATNLSTLVFDGTGSGSARISNVSVGGATNNVLIIAPNGMNNAAFGEGMNNVTVLAHVINSIRANQGAINTQVYSDRTISQVMFGGPVDNTFVISGVAQNYTNIFDSVTGQSSSPFIAGTVTAPPLPINAQNGGGMTVVVAGNVTDSVFAASAQPGTAITTVSNPTTGVAPGYGTPQDLILPTGHIRGKIEGTIDNSNVTPNKPGTAFYAKTVTKYQGPVVPPNIPSQPYTGPQQYVALPGLRHPTKAGDFTRSTKKTK